MKIKSALFAATCLTAVAMLNAGTAFANGDYAYYQAADGMYRCYQVAAPAGVPAVDNDYCAEGRYGWWLAADNVYHCYPLNAPAGTVASPDWHCSGIPAAAE